jgi:MerR family regulatory protein
MSGPRDPAAGGACPDPDNRHTALHAACAGLPRYPAKKSKTPGRARKGRCADDRHRPAPPGTSHGAVRTLVSAGTASPSRRPVTASSGSPRNSSPGSRVANTSATGSASRAPGFVVAACPATYIRETRPLSLLKACQIGQAAEVCGLTIDTRRYWERAGLTLWPTPRAVSGQRRYPERLPGPRRCASPRSCCCLDQGAELSRNARSRASMRRSKVASMDSGRPKPPAISSEARPWQAARHMRIAWMRSAPSRW